MSSQKASVIAVVDIAIKFVVAIKNVSQQYILALPSHNAQGPTTNWAATTSSSSCLLLS